MYLSTAILTLAIILGSSPQNASGADRHPVQGVLKDPAGLAVAGAALVLTPADPSRAPEQVLTTTDRSGFFRFEPVAEGEYVLDVAVEGFAEIQQSVKIENGPVKLRLRLEMARVRETATVVASSEIELSTDPAENRDTVEIDQEMLDGLPVMDQDAVSLMAEFLDGDPMGGGGGGLIVDGMESSTLGVTPSAIQEVRVNKNPYSAEYSRSGRGRIEVITKKGTPEYHGEFNFVMRDQHLDARHAFARDKPKRQRRRFEGILTGRLGKSGKNTFLISAERDEDDRESIVFAETLAGLEQGNFPSLQRDSEFSARFNRYQSDQHVFGVRYSMDREFESGRGVGGFSLPENGYDDREESHRLYLNHKWFVSPAWFTELSVRVRREDDRAVSADSQARRIVVLDSFTSGGAQRSEIESQTDLDLVYVASYSGKGHFVRTGLQIPDWTRHTLDDRSNFGGTFVFASLADFEAGNPFSFTVQQGESRLSFPSRAVSLFVQDDIRLRPGLTLGLGMRYDRQKFLADANNFAPRASLAWKLGKEGNMVLRTGAGVFYNRTDSSAIRDSLRFDGERLRRIVISNPSYPDPNLGSGEISDVPPSIVRFAPDLRFPYLTQFSLGLERKLPRSLMLTVSYVRVRGTKLLRSVDRNAPLPPDYVRPDPTLGIVREIESSGTLKSHSLRVNLRARMGRVFRGRILYSLSRAWADTRGRDGLPPNSLDRSSEWARTGWDRRHRFRIYGTTRLPASVRFGTILRAYSGRPYDWTTGVDTNRDGSARERPEGVPRNALDGPGQFNVDFRLSRKFPLQGKKEGAELRVALDAFNVFNRVNFSRVVGNESSSFFGQPVSAWPARRLQLSARVSF